VKLCPRCAHPMRYHGRCGCMCEPRDEETLFCRCMVAGPLDDGIDMGTIHNRTGLVRQ
jgi:hypothetical protein